jgi:hypothetical protein
MKKIFTLCILLYCFSSSSQIFNGAGGAILNNGGQKTVFNLSVTGLTQNLDSLYGLEEVCLQLDHPAVEETHIYLTSPAGTVVELTGVLSCSGNSFSVTCFNQNATSSVAGSSAPFNGSFIPVGNLGRFNTNKTGNGQWQLHVKDFVAGANAGMLVSWSLKFSSSPAKPVVFTSSNLPLVFLNTNNQVLNDQTDIIIDLGIVDNGVNRNYLNDARNNYNGKAACNVRGSSSQMFEKQCFKIELRDGSGVNQIDAPLLGMPKGSDWALTSGYSDKTLLRNSLTHHLFQSMGHYSPRVKFVELFIDGEYFGVYALTEKIKRGKSRVNVSKITNLDNQAPYITGGYIFQINRTDDPGWYSKYPGISVTNSNFYYQYVYPTADHITPQQQAYIKACVDSFETVMQSPTFNDPFTGYKKFINENTFIDFLILNELSKNVDGYRLSTYLYKEDMFHGGKISIGPMWDYDLAWHNCNFGNASSPLYWQHEQTNDVYPIPTWWMKLMQDDYFKDKLYCRYHTLRQNELSNTKIFQYIDEMTVHLDEAQKRNYKQFPILGAYIYPNPQAQAGATYTSEINDLKQWVINRSAWMDSHIPGFCTTIGVHELSSTEFIKIFPNPFNSQLTIELRASESNLQSFTITDILGKDMNVKAEAVDRSHLRVATGELSPGTYIVRLNVDGVMYQQKIVKTE